MSVRATVERVERHTGHYRDPVFSQETQPMFFGFEKGSGAETLG